MLQKDVTDLENIKQESTDMVKTRDYDKPSQDCDAGKKMGRNASQKICLAALLYLVDHQMDTVLVTRAILCQVINYHSNSDARSAISAKEFIDISGTTFFLSLSQMTKYRLVQLESICRWQNESSSKDDFVFDRVEKILRGKGENAGYQHFVLFPQCFQNVFRWSSFKFLQIIVFYEEFWLQWRSK